MKQFISIGIIITLTLVLLKITGQIEWEWFWVVSPFIIELLLFVLFMLAFVLLLKYKGNNKFVIKTMMWYIRVIEKY